MYSFSVIYCIVKKSLAYQQRYRHLLYQTCKFDYRLSFRFQIFDIYCLLNYRSKEAKNQGSFRFLIGICLGLKEFYFDYRFDELFKFIEFIHLHLHLRDSIQRQDRYIDSISLIFLIKYI